MKRPVPSGLYLILGQSSCGKRDSVQVATEALESGVRLIQYREKGLPRREAHALAQRLRKLTRHFGATFLINDDVDLALLVQADGVHLGDEDFPPAEARRLLGDGAVIGYSTHTVEEARAADALEPVDYLGFGPLFESTTKQTTRPAVGIDALRQVTSTVSLPVFAIGGILPHHVPEILASGAWGYAVIQGILGQDSIPDAVMAYSRMTGPPPCESNG